MSDRKVLCDDVVDRDFLRELRGKATDMTEIVIPSVRPYMVKLAEAADCLDAVLMRAGRKSIQEPPCSEP